MAAFLGFLLKLGAIIGPILSAISDFLDRMEARAARKAAAEYGLAV